MFVSRETRSGSAQGETPSYVLEVTDIPAPDAAESSQQFTSGGKKILKQNVLRRGAPWLGLVCIFAVYLIVVVRLHPTNFFGYTTDDTIYLSSAKAIAQGKGYILPSFPGTPRPWLPVLYPWILSWVWHWNPSFPSNITDAVRLSVFFALIFVTLMFVFLRQLGGLSDAEALVLTLVCALHPVVVFYGANIVTELPFAALALGAMIAADRAFQPGSAAKWAVLCGFLAGLSAQARIIGLAIVAGMAVAGLARRAWRQLVVFSACAGLFLTFVLWHFLSSARARPQQYAGATANFGWTRIWIYYTSYLGFWRASIPDIHVLAIILKKNLLVVPGAPSFYLLYPSLLRGGIGVLVLILAVTALIFAGIVRQARRYGWKVIHFVLPFYAAIAFVWSFSDPYRYFIPFLALFVAGYWFEVKRIGALIRAGFARHRPLTEMSLAAVLAGLLLAGNLALAWNYLDARKKLVWPISTERAEILPAKLAAYEWISKNTSPDSRFVAYEDAGLYLYTGRQSVRQIALNHGEFFEPERMKFALDHWTDVALAVHADYWVVSSDDFRNESPATAEVIRGRMQELERSWPIVFRSSDGHVTIYSLSCMQDLEEQSCKSSARMLTGGH